jgi:hypothetical protein
MGYDCSYLALLIFLFLIGLTKSHFQVVKESGKYDAYLLMHRTHVRKIPDNETLHFLGYSFDSIETIESTVFNTYAVMDPVESMKPRDMTPDEIVRVNALKFQTLQDSPGLVQTLRKIGNIWNPSVVKWKGFNLLVSIGDGLGDDKIYIKLAFLHDNLTYLSESKYGIGPGLRPLENSKQIPGGDPRVLVLSENRFLVAFTGSYNPIRMRAVEIGLNASSGVATIELEYRIDPVPSPGIGKVDHKNWSPFIFNKTQVLYIETVNPLRILCTLPFENDPLDQSVRSTRLVSATATPNIVWPYGDIRGGSPAMHIGNGRYLSFFHSRRILEYNQRTTYFFGAFTFTDQPPFTLTAMSRAPIYHPHFYDGPWDHIRFYVSFFCGVVPILGNCLGLF